MKKLNLGLLALVMLTLFACGKKNISLKLKLQKLSKIDIKYRRYLVVNNKDDDPLNNEYTRLSLSVDSVLQDSSYQFSVKIDYTRVKYKSLLARRCIEYSSDKDTAEMSPAEKIIEERERPAINATYKFALDKYGKVIQPLSVDGGVIRRQNSFFDPEIYQIKFPDYQIAIGEDWDTETAAPGTKKRRKATYHIERIDNSIIQIKAEGVVWDEGGNLTHFTGRYLLDRNTCSLISCNLETDGKVAETGDPGKLITSIETK